MTSTAANPRPPDIRPLWIPDDVKFDRLPPALQRAITEIIGPAYEEVVLAAQSGLERSMGVTYVHLLWLALIEMIDIARDMGPGLALGEGTDKHQKKIARHLRLVGQKDRIAKFLLEVQRFYDRGADKDRRGGPR
jgi:hypothetical protein